MNENESHFDSEAPSEAELMIMQAQATATLSAMAVGHTDMVMAQLSDIWAKSCMEKVFYMATWTTIAGQAARVAGLELNMIIGEDGKPKENLTTEDAIAESFLNLMLRQESEANEQAFDAMHDFLHEAEDTAARGVFVAVLSACAQAAKECMNATIGEPFKEKG